jgi:hypothetical protein
MAGNTILKLCNAFFNVFFGRIFGFMFVAVVAGIVSIGFGMTGLAGYLAFIAMIEREGVAGKFGGRPGCCGVAADTIGSKQAGMDLRFGMAANTVGRRSGNNLIGMAAGTIHFRMSPFEGKEIIVVEGVDQGVTAVVAGKAVLAEQSGVVGCEIGLALCVAAYAINQVSHKLLLKMTVGTCQLRLVKISLVFGQTEIGQAVVFEIRQGQKGDIGIPPFMLRMAGLAPACIM